MIKRYITILFTCIFCVILPIRTDAQVVAKSKATEFARNFFASKAGSFAPHSEYIDVLHDENKLPALYVIRFPEKGFVLVAADSAAFPVLGYSLKDHWPVDNLPDEVSEWLKNYTDQIYQIRKQKLKPDSKIRTAWIQPETIFNFDRNQRSVEPLTLSKWDQGIFYNDSCPEVNGGDAGRAYAGCVPVAMAQVMYFHRHPAQGNGSHSYSIKDIGVQTADFGNTMYNWNGMLLKADRPSPYLSQLIYHCGVSVDATYAATGTGAKTEKTVNALKDYFGYSHDAIFYEKIGYPDSVWKAMLQSNLELNRPLIYKGSMGGWVGHSWVCDGFDGSDYFHFNWGWSGTYNGYYYLNNLNPGNYNFSTAQGAVFNIHPIESSAPPAETDTITAPSGSFCNHQWPEADSPSSTHRWLIYPQGDNYEYLQIMPEMARLYEGDSLLIFEGNDLTNPPLYILTQGNIPDAIHLNNSVAFVKSISHSGQSKWALSYLAHDGNLCQNNTIFTSINGHIKDGSGNFYLHPETNCSWLIQPHTQELDSVSKIEIRFQKFMLNSTDSVFIFDGPDIHYPLLAALGGNDQPQTLISSGNKVFIQLKTDTLSATANGIEIRYHSILPQYCQQQIVLNSTSGTITNGSNGRNYHNNTLCDWLIDTEDTKDITITFNKLNTELNRDRIEFYRAGAYPEELLKMVSGDEIPAPFTLTGNKFRVIFRTDGTIVNKGWEFEYNINSLAIEKLTSPLPVYYPVPAENVLVLKLPYDFRSSRFIISDITGKQLYTGQTENTNEFSVNISFLKPGIYLFSMQGIDKGHTFRFIKK